MEDKQLRIKDLVELLNKASEKYYNGIESGITDKQWDTMFDELKKLEEETGIVLANSPTQKVGSLPILKGFTKVEHKNPMLSAGKTKDLEEVLKWCNNKNVYCSYKLDGCSVQIEYRNGELYQAVSRGTGLVGCDITQHAKTFGFVPLKIPFDDTLIVRGECVMSYTNFNKINVNNEFANPRNLVSGTLNQLDVNVCRERKLDFIVFEVVQGLDCDTMLYSFDKLTDLGFKVVLHTIAEVYNLETLTYAVDWMKNLKFDYPIDGLVFRYDNNEYARSLGKTSHHPLDILALKFYDDTQETTLIDIEWDTSRTGLINPIAIFKPIEIDGCEITRASLHNLDFIKNLELGIGDTIEVSKRNQIIPHVEENLTRSNTYQLPSVCPCCGHKAEIVNTGTANVLKCNNPECKAQLVSRLSHFVSRNCMNIDGLSEATLEKFVENGFVKHIVDIFNLEEHKFLIMNMEGFGVKSYEKLIKNIDKATHCKLENFIHALGITNVGKSTSKVLAKKFKEYCNIKNASLSDLMSIKDIGDTTANSIYNFFHTDDSYYADILATCILDIEVESEKLESKGGVFDGMLIYCTGTFANYKKNQLKEIVESNGGTFANGYAKGLSMLCVGSLKGSSKQEKAIKDGVRVVTEEEFIDMIK